MTYQDLLLEIPKLSVQERIDLMKALARSIYEAPIDSARAEATVRHLFGVLATDKPAPTDEEVDQIRFEYLMEKYS
jgi:isopentenyldiphosphate isomerase